jgi:hypothetical protein
MTSSDFDPTAEMECEHEWIANSGRGGEPVFTRQQIVAGDTPVMHVACSKCNTRTWFTEAKWHALPRPGETRQESRRRQREAAVIARRHQEGHATEMRARQAEFERTGTTYWNGEPAECRQVIVRVGKSPVSTWWCADLEGKERRAVDVTSAGQVFYLDNEDGSAWAKVTVGRGSPGYGHRGFPNDSELVRVIE